MEVNISEPTNGFKTWHIILIVIGVIIVIVGSILGGVYFMMPEPTPPPPPPQTQFPQETVKLPEQTTATEASGRQTEIGKGLSDESVRALEASRITSQADSKNDTQKFLEWMGIVKTLEQPSNAQQGTTIPKGTECTDDVDCDGFDSKCDNGYCKKFSKVAVGDIVQMEFSTTSNGVCASNDKRSRMVAEGLVRKVDNTEQLVHIQWYALKNKDPIEGKETWECSWSRDSQPSDWVALYFGDENTDPERDYGLKSVVSFKEVVENMNVISNKTLEATFTDPIMVTMSGCYQINDEPYNEANVVYVNKDQTKCRVTNEEARAVMCKDSVTKKKQLEVLPRNTDPKTLETCTYVPRAGPGGDCSVNGVCLPGSSCGAGKCFEICDKIPEGYNLGCFNAADVPRVGTYNCDYNSCTTQLEKRRADKMCYCCTKITTDNEKEECSLQPIIGCNANEKTYCKYM